MRALRPKSSTDQTLADQHIAGQESAGQQVTPRPDPGQLLYGSGRQGTKHSQPTTVDNLARELAEPVVDREARTRELTMKLQAHQSGWGTLPTAMKAVIRLMDGRSPYDEGIYAKPYAWRVVTTQHISKWLPLRNRKPQQVLQATDWFAEKLDGGGALDYTRPSWKKAITIDPQRQSGAWSLFEEQLEKIEAALAPKN